MLARLVKLKLNVELLVIIHQPGVFPIVMVKKVPQPIPFDTVVVTGTDKVKTEAVDITLGVTAHSTAT